VATINVLSQANGCTGNPYLFNITVNPLPTGSITSSATYVCEGSTQLLSISGGSSYQWFINGNPIASATQSTYAADIPGTYSVQIFNTFGCSSQSTNNFPLGYRAKPQASFVFDRYCVGIPTTFRDQSSLSQVGTVSYNWTFGVAGATSTQQNPQYTYAQAGAYTVTLTVTPQDCPSLASQTSQVLQVRNPPPSIRYPTIDAIKNKNQLLQARNFLDASYSWIPSSGLNNPSIRAPFFNYDREMEYLIRIQTAEGCRVTDSLLVRVFPESGIFVATAFSPNRDGQNDKLYPRLVGVTTLKIFRVYDRWGQLMFQTNIDGNGWDGKFKGVDQPMDTYAWVAEAIDNEGKLIRKAGVSSLLR
jgi:gliding motility-associated-like protein